LKIDTNIIGKINLMRQLTLIKSLNEAIDEEMAAENSIVCFGEDMGAYGGVWALSKGLQKKYGDQRVFDTPLAEAAIVGTAVGCAMAGLRPVIELMYIDFSSVCADPLINQAAKIHLMSGGQFNVPMTIVAPYGAGTCEAAQHSNSPEAWFLNTPGLKVVTPSTIYDHKGLLRSAIKDDNPVMFLWHKALYELKEEVPEGTWEVPLGQAAIRSEGSDLTLVAYSLMAHRAKEAIENLGSKYSVELIDPRSLHPFDKDAVIQSLGKTGRLLVVHESPMRCGVGADIVRMVTDEAYDQLTAAPKVLGGKDTPMPFAKPLENAAVPQVDDIEQAIVQMLGQRTQVAV
jgi:pyruvate/2-oxoglutarate/acetoin dehydrogenase E1 component